MSELQVLGDFSTTERRGTHREPMGPLPAPWPVMAGPVTFAIVAGGGQVPVHPTLVPKPTVD